MKVRLILTFGLAARLTLLLTAEPGRALIRAAQPRTAVAVASGTASDPVRVAVPRQHLDGDRNVHLAPSAPCEVSGLITADTTWGPSLCDPYIVTGNVSVQSGATLTILPGTTVKFDSLKALAVAGTLVACGAEGNRITFTSNLPGPAAGDWAYIYFANSSTDASADRDCSGHGSGSIIQDAIIEYAGGGSASYNAALRIESSSPVIGHNTIRDNSSNGIRLWETGAAPRITGNTISGNSGNGIIAGNFINSKTVISGNAVTGNTGRGIYVDDRVIVSGNVITGNTGGGIYVNSNATISDNRISDNSASTGGGINVTGYGSAPTISGNVIVNNRGRLANRGGGIYVANNTSPVINDNDLYGNVTGNPANVPIDLYNGNEYGRPDVDATNNYWGTADCDEVEGYVWHFTDEPDLGIIDYEPCRYSSIITPTSILTPTLYAISNPDRNGDYTVDWSDVTGALTYTLHEDDNADFASPTTRYTGSASQHTVNGQAAGTWYYRVKAANASGESGWSNVQSTTVVSPTQGDAYEPDDICEQASALATDGTPQSHTFHDSGDADWAHFTVTSGITYVVQATSTSSGADLVLELYDACGGNLEGSDDDAFGNDARLLFVAPSSGTYYVRALNHEPGVYGPGVTYELSVRAQMPGGAVLIVAGHDDNYRLQNHILYAANYAYRTFLKGGILEAHIRYLSAIDDDDRTDPDGDGVSDVYASSASANVQTAITTWAANLTDSHTPFYLYLVDHGGVDTFLTDGIGDTITPTTLSGWLDALEAPVSVIYEACHSGSFIDGLEEISEPGRVVIASTGRLNSAYPTPGRGAYFSDAFFTALGQSQDLWTSFQEGVRAVGATGLWQTPWLDDDGDAAPNTPSDGAVARGRGLANFGFPVGRPPVVDEVLPPVSVQGGRCILRARARDDVRAVQVWAVVYPPSFDEPEPPPDGTMPDLGLPKVDLSDSNDDGVYEGVYEGCTEEGTYRLVVYAEDSEGNLSQPAVLEVRKWQVYLPLVMR